jgi:DNA-binding beta-propeller fold protein YncE
MQGTYLGEFGMIGGFPGAFYTPKGITLTNDSIFVANTRNHSIYQFSKTSYQLIQTFGLLGDDAKPMEKGSRDYRFRLPAAVAIRSDGVLLVSDSKHNLIRAISNNGEFLFQFGVAGNGPGQFNQPEGVAIDSENRIYVCDSLNQRVQRFTQNGTYIDKIDQGFIRPVGIFIDAENRIFISDNEAHSVKILRWS